MDRRRYLQSVIPGVAISSGCSRLNADDDPDAESSITLDESRCDETQPTVEITDQSEGTIEFWGIIETVPEGHGLSAGCYVSSVEESAICEVGMSEHWAPPSASCRGSVSYSGEIVYSNLELSEVRFIHMAAGEQEFGKTISVDG